jgi:hypothetical protein
MPFGYARDSIADLQSLAHADDDGNFLDVDTSSAPHAYKLGTSPAKDDNDYNDMLLMENEHEAPLTETGIASDKTLPVKNTTTPSTPAATTSTSIPLKMKQQSKLVVENSPSRMSNPSGRSRNGKTHDLRRTASVTMAEQKKKTAVYSGFDYSDYYADSYSNSEGTPKKGKKNILCCLFPFLEDPLLSDDEYGSGSDGDDDISFAKEDDDASQLSLVSFSDPGFDVDLQTENDLTNVAVEKAKVAEAISPSSTASTSASAEDASSTLVGSVILQPNSPANSAANSPANSPQKSDAEPPKTPPTYATVTATDTATIKNKGLEIEPEPEAKIEPPSTPTIKGILKRTVIKPITLAKSGRVLSTIPNSFNHDKDSNGGIKRRTILPTYETAPARSQTLDDSVHTQPKSVSFSHMARVMPVLPRSEMSYFTKSTIWWQRNDYDDFKKTGRIIAKAMIQGGSEIWLQTSDAWGRSQGKKTSAAAAASLAKKGEQHSAEYKSALKKYGVEEENEEKSFDDDDDDMSNKWWCKFGHSRRGLEHIVSVNEGRQRQKLVNASVTAVLEEQRRQRISRRDSRKIASISMQYTAWAKDLASAAGEADEEAVKCKFSVKARGRLSYLNTSLLSRTTADKTEGKPCASFVLTANSAFLDSYTHKSGKKSMKKETSATSVTEHIDDIAHKAAGFQFQKTIDSQQNLELIKL